MTSKEKDNIYNKYKFLNRPTVFKSISSMFDFGFYYYNSDSDALQSDMKIIMDDLNNAFTEYKRGV